MYRSMHAILLVFCAYYVICNAVPSQNNIALNSQKILGSEKHVFRDAVREDIDDLITVVMDAFAPSAAWRYIRPEPEKYYNYTWHCQREVVLKEWDGNGMKRNTSFVKVVAVPDTNASNGRSERVVSVGVWNLKSNDSETATTDLFTEALFGGLSTNTFSSSHHHKKYDCDAHLDVNITRSVDAQPQMDRAMSRYIFNAHPKQMYLNMLATHPDWDGHGFAALNLQWGIALAKTLEEPVTLMSSPAGYPLYRDTGFRSVKNVTVTTLDGWNGGTMWSEVMEYSYKSTHK